MAEYKFKSYAEDHARPALVSPLTSSMSYSHITNQYMGNKNMFSSYIYHS